MNIAKLLEQNARDFPQRSAVIFKGNTISFLELRDFVFRLAYSLNKLGVAKGDSVAIYLPNWPEYIYSYLAIWCCSATVVPLDFMLTEEELVSCLAHSQTSLLITKPKANISFINLKENCPALKNIIICGSEDLNNTKIHLSFEALLEEGHNITPSFEAKDKDYAIIFYTSGTTGKPKGVLINYKQLSASPEAMEYFSGINDKDISLCALPLSHIGGLVFLYSMVFSRTQVVLMERFFPLEFIKNIQDYKVTCFWLVPPMYYALLGLKEFEIFDLSSLHWIVVFGAPSSPEMLKRFHKICPAAKFMNGWGMTETNAPSIVIPFGSEKIESVGKPAPWIEVKIVSSECVPLSNLEAGSSCGDEEEKGLPVGSIGEIVVKSWVVTDGYYKDPELTRETIRNGWFHTGDLGRFDEEGFFYIVGRKKEMIKVGGEIVFEPEVEASLLRHPEVTEVAVIGVKDNLRGEVPKAFVVLKNESKLNQEDLRYFCRQHLAHFKIPHYFELRSYLPKNRAGKIDKESLRKESQDA